MYVCECLSVRVNEKQRNKAETRPVKSGNDASVSVVVYTSCHSFCCFFGRKKQTSLLYTLYTEC